ncbi:MAG: alkaline phosphatase family protein [Acutalibacteraceae bacterium]
MADLFDSICISSVKNTVLYAMGLELSESSESVNPVLKALKDKKLGRKNCDRAVLYNPDAVALWLYQKHTEKFTDAILCSDVALPMYSVMPSVTPVCFGSMYTGVQPEVHGIRKYEKPVLKHETLFDCLIKQGKKCAIVSTEGDSISKIFLERKMDYFIYDTLEEVNEKALEIIDRDIYDLIVIYNGNYDGTMHREGTEAEESFEALKQNVEFYKTLVDTINEKWTDHNVFYGFMPDHGCHDIDGGCGSHGLEMEEDMNVIHFYGIK